MQRKIYELTETETKAVIGGARLPVSAWPVQYPTANRPDRPARS